MKKNFSLVTGFGILIWLVISLIGYIYLHKPFQPDQATLWLTFGWQIIFTGIIISIEGGIGYSFLKAYMNNRSITNAVIQVALGMGILAIVVLLLGVITLNIIVFIAVLTLLIVILHNDILDWFKQWQQLITFKPNGAFMTLMAVFVLVIIFLPFFTALSPPIRFDALTYHLSLPRTYLLNGRITYLPENIFWGMPQLTEMNYMLDMAFAGTESAPLLGWAIGVLAVLGILDYTTKNFNLRAGWVAIAVILSGESFASALGWGYVDWVVILYGFAFLVIIEKWSISYNKINLILAAIFAGMALSTKYTAGILFLTGIVIIFISQQTNNEKLATLFIFSCVAIITVSPWLIKNIIATGNPVYPLFFPSGEMDYLRIYKYHRSPASTNWWRLLSLPWDMTVWGVEGSSGYGASIGPLFLGLSPLAFLNWNAKSQTQRNIIRISAIIIAQCFLISAIGSQFAGLLGQSRLFFALFPAWAVMAAAGFDAASQVNTKQIRFSKIIPVLVLLPLAFSLLQSSIEFTSLSIPSYLFQNLSKDKFFELNLGAYQQAINAINALPPNTKILMLWETRSLACLPKCDGDEIIDRWYHDWRTLGDTQKILERWQDEGYTHVLYNRTGSDFIRETEKRKYTPQDWEGLDEMLSFLGIPKQTFNNQYFLYDIRPTRNK